MLRLEVDAQSAVASSTASLSPSAINVSSVSSGSTALPSLNELYRQQLLGLQPAHSGWHQSTSASTLSCPIAPPAPVAQQSRASLSLHPSRQSLSSPIDDLLPAFSRQSLSEAHPSSSRLSVGSQPYSIGRQSLSSPSLSPSPAGMRARGSASRPSHSSLGRHSSPHKLALHPSTAQHIAKHQSQTTLLSCIEWQRIAQYFVALLLTLYCLSRVVQDSSPRPPPQRCQSLPVCCTRRCHSPHPLPPLLSPQ